MQKIYLVLTALVLGLMGLLFTLAPQANLTAGSLALSDPKVLPVLRSLGGFYVGFAAFLLAGLMRPALAQGAVTAATLVMLGLFLSRILSLGLDGLPDARVWLSLGIELIFAVWGAVLVRRAWLKSEIR